MLERDTQRQELNKVKQSQAELAYDMEGTREETHKLTQQINQAEQQLNKVTFTQVYISACINPFVGSEGHRSTQLVLPSSHMGIVPLFTCTSILKITNPSQCYYYCVAFAVSL